MWCSSWHDTSKNVFGMTNIIYKKIRNIITIILANNQCDQFEKLKSAAPNLSCPQGILRWSQACEHVVFCANCQSIGDVICQNTWLTMTFLKNKFIATCTSGNVITNSIRWHYTHVHRLHANNVVLFYETWVMKNLFARVLIRSCVPIFVLFH